jgi:hypothetical protein
MHKFRYIFAKPFADYAWHAMPDCLRGMTCADAAECIDDLPEDLRGHLLALDYLPLADVWPHMSYPARKVVSRGAEQSERDAVALFAAL